MRYTKLALRNVFRHRRRSVVTIFAIVLGFTAVSVVGGVLNNIFTLLRHQAIAAERLGHLTVAKQGYFSEGKLNPEKFFWSRAELDEIRTLIGRDDAVELVTPRMRLFGLSSNGEATTIFLSEAVVPDDDARITQLRGDQAAFSKVVGLNESGDEGVVVGEELAQLLGIGPGDLITLVTQTHAGMVNATDAPVSAVYNTGNPATNDKFVLMPFRMAQELYEVDGADRLVVLLKEGSDLDEARSRLSAALAGGGHGVEIRSWSELSLFYEKVVTMFTVIFRVVTLVVSVVVLLALINTMISAVGERTAEIGTLRAMGLKRRAVTRLFATEGVFVGLIGCALGLPVVGTVATAINHASISFIPPVSSAPVPVAVRLAPQWIVIAAALFIVNALLAAFFASRRAARRPIVEALGH